MPTKVLVVEGLAGDGGVDISVVSLLTLAGCDSNVPKRGGIQFPILSMKTDERSVSSVMDCHINGHSNTMSGAQHSRGVIITRIDADDGTVLLLVRIPVLLIHGVLRVPAITQIGHHLS